MRPELVEEFIAEFHAEINRQRARAEAEAKVKERELADVQRRLDGLVDAIADGFRSEGLQDKLDSLERRKAGLEAVIATGAASAPRLHPRLADLYRQKVEKLHEALSDPRSQDEALELLRSLIQSVKMHPTDHGFDIELVGEIAHIVQAALQEAGYKHTSFSKHAVCSVKVVAGTRNQRYLPSLACRIPRIPHLFG